MAEVIKSNSTVAENVSSLIKAQGDSIQQIAADGSSLTNLTVIGKMQNAIDYVNKINSAYKELLSKDATTISDVKDTYNTLDNAISDSMGIK